MRSPLLVPILAFLLLPAAGTKAQQAGAACPPFERPAAGDGGERVSGEKTDITAKRIVRRGTKSLELSEEVAIHSDKILIRAEEASAENKNGNWEARAQGVEYAIVGRTGHGRAATVETDGKNKSVLTDASYTHCPEERKWWEMKAGKITVDREAETVRLRNAVLYAGKVPVFWLPAARFSLDGERKTGLELPSLGHDGDDGFTYRQGFYLRLGERAGAELSAQYIGRRGVLWGGEINYESRYGEWRAEAQHLGGDKLAEKEVERGKIAPDALGDRWLYRFRQRGFYGEWRTRVHYAKVSDAAYEQDFDFSAGRAGVIRRGAEVAWSNAHWQARLGSDGYQLLRGTQRAYNRDLYFALNRRSAAALFSPEYLLDVYYDKFSAVSTTRTQTYAKAERLRGEFGLAFPLAHKNMRARPFVRWRGLSHDFGDDTPEKDARARDIFWGVDASADFSRHFSRGGNRYLQTLRPRLSYFHSERARKRPPGPADFDTRRLNDTPWLLFHPGDFSGGDRLDGARRLDLGVESRVMDTDTGRELLSFSVGRIFHPGRRENPLPGEGARPESKNPLIGSLQYRPRDNWTLDGQWVVDAGSGNPQSALLGSRHVAPDKGGGFFWGFRYFRDEREDSTRQINLSFDKILHSNWKIEGSWHHDLFDNQEIDIGLGVSYLSCCFKFTVEWKRELEVTETNDAITIRFGF